jgi:hypothetical protein
MGFVAEARRHSETGYFQANSSETRIEEFRTDRGSNEQAAAMRV